MFTEINKSNQFKFCKTKNNTFYCVQNIGDACFEICGSATFKSVFINKKLTLNKTFNVAIFI